MSKIVGADLGNDASKIVFSPTEQFSIRNSVKKVMLTEIRKDLSFGEDAEKNILDDLDVTIKSAKINGRFFVGPLATRVGEDKVEPGTRKVNNDTIAIPLVTLLALMMDSKTKEEHFKQVSGLPITEYSEDRESFIKKIVGKYNVQFNSGKLKGQTKIVNIDDVNLIPEGVAVVLNRMFNDTGSKFRDESLRTKQVGVIDIGAFTTDLPIVINGKPDSQASDGIPEGIANYLDKIIEYVNQQYHINMTRSQLVEKIESKNLNVSIKGVDVDLSPYIEEQFEMFANKIVAIVDRIWEKHYEITQFFVVGGGVKALRPYLERKMNERGIKLTFIEDEDPQMQNALGYYKYAKQLYAVKK
ncbi:hypothetical protein D3C74_91790 [compost metagenome]